MKTKKPQWAKTRYYEMLRRIIREDRIFSDIHHTLDNSEIVIEYHLAERLRNRLMYNYWN